MRLLLVALLFCCIHKAGAATLTDTWWNPAQPGWGVSVVHDDDRLTIGLFVHDAAGDPRWYSAALERVDGSPAERPEFSGTLFETRRVAGALAPTAAGPMVFRAQPDGKALLEYTIGVDRHTAQIERFSFTPDHLEGLFVATLLPGYGNCRAGFEPLKTLVAGVMSAERCEGADCGLQSPDTPRDRSPIHIRFHDLSGEVCRVDGRFARYGVSGGIKGTYRCIDGGEGDIEMQNIEFTSVGFNAHFTAGHPACGEFFGVLSGIRADAR